LNVLINETDIVDRLNPYDLQEFIKPCKSLKLNTTITDFCMSKFQGLA